MSGPGSSEMTLDPFAAIPKDKGWAWMCLIGGLLMNTILPGGIFKTFGVIFNDVEEKFNSSAAMLSWIPAISVALALMLGSVTNGLANRFTTRLVVIVGSIFIGTGFVLSSLAGSMPVFFFTYGICIGIGSGMIYPPGVVFVGRYFVKYRGFANGVSLSGSGLGSIVMPPLMMYTLDTYGLEGTLLIMAGIAMNLCVAAMLFRPAKFYLERYCLKMARQRRFDTAVLMGDKDIPKVKSAIKYDDGAKTKGYINTVFIDEIYVDQDMVTDANCQQKEEWLSRKSLHSEESDDEDCNERSKQKSLPSEQSDYENCSDGRQQKSLNSEADGEDCCKESEANGMRPRESVHDSEFELDHSGKLCKNAVIKNAAELDDTENAVSMGISAVGVDHQSIADTRFTSSDDVVKKPPIFEFALLRNPILLIYAASMALGLSNFFNMFIMATPHAELLGFSHTKGSMLVSIMGASDMVARIAAGVLADFNVVKKQHIFHACLAVCSAILFVLPSLKSYAALTCGCVIFAAAGGGFMSIFPTLLAESMGIDRMPTAYGMVMFSVGGALLVVPAMTGRLRDVTGSWSVSFYTCGGLYAVATLLNFSIPLATKWEQRRPKT